MRLPLTAQSLFAFLLCSLMRAKKRFKAGSDAPLGHYARARIHYRREHVTQIRTCACAKHRHPTATRPHTHSHTLTHIRTCAYASDAAAVARTQLHETVADCKSFEGGARAVQVAAAVAEKNKNDERQQNAARACLCCPNVARGPLWRGGLAPKGQ